MLALESQEEFELMNGKYLVLQFQPHTNILEKVYNQKCYSICNYEYFKYTTASLMLKMLFALS